MSKFNDLGQNEKNVCWKCHQVLQPLSNCIAHYCETQVSIDDADN